MGTPMGLEKSMFLYAMLITIGVYATLALTFLNSQGLILSKNAQLTKHNAELLQGILDRSQAMSNGTIKTAGLNLTMQNNHLLHEILENLTKTG